MLSVPVGESSTSCVASAPTNPNPDLDPELDPELDPDPDPVPDLGPDPDSDPDPDPDPGPDPVLNRHPSASADMDSGLCMSAHASVLSVASFFFAASIAF